MNELFAKKLKDYREELSLKRGYKVGQVKLAFELGISKGTIGNLESAKRLPSKKILLKLSEHSGKSLDYWMEGIDGFDPPNTVDLVLDKLIESKLITDINLDSEIWDIIKEAVIVEIKRKLY